MSAAAICLVIGAACSALAALLHLGCIAFGAPWYRFFGAGQGMLRLVEAGRPLATFITLGITAVLGLWSAYALAGAGVLPALPLQAYALPSLCAVYLGRGALGFLLAKRDRDPTRSVAFWRWSSAVCLAIGGVHLAGLLAS
jgi:hypothetical protein